MIRDHGITIINLFANFSNEGQFIQIKLPALILCKLSPWLRIIVKLSWHHHIIHVDAWDILDTMADWLLLGSHPRISLKTEDNPKLKQIGKSSFKTLKIWRKHSLAIIKSSFLGFIKTEKLIINRLWFWCRVWHKVFVSKIWW